MRFPFLPTPLILPLDARSEPPEAQVGGKGASLFRLQRNGFHIPPGFVVSATAFDRFVAGAAGGLARQRHWPREERERWRERLTSLPMPEALAGPIRQAYHRIGGRVAVRSSMVGEDGWGISFAGQLDTLLDVDGAEPVLQAVRYCWASVLNWRLLTYLNERESSRADTGWARFSMAVVVQRMVAAQAAGVAFSADPLTGQDRVVVEATHGLGEAVARGLVTPDRWVVDSRGALVEATRHSPDAPALNEGQALALAVLVRRVAAQAGAPQDVEWAWDGNEFYLLQARPITSLTREAVYSSRFVSEMVPGLIKPLVWFTTTSAITDNVFAHVFAELLGPGKVEAATLVRRIHSRLYANITLLGRACEQLGLPANFFEAITRGERAQVRRAWLSLHNLPAKFRLARFVVRHSRAAPRIAAFIARRQRELEPFRQTDWSIRTPPELLSAVAELSRLHGEAQWHIFITALNMSVRNRLLSRLVQRAAPDVTAGDLLSGVAGVRGLAPHTALHSLAGQARALDAATQSRLLTDSPEAIRAALAQTPPGRVLIEAFDDFVGRYGFLSANGTDFSLPTWGETPALIWQMIGRWASQPPPSRTEALARQNQARRRARARLSVLQRWWFDRLLASTIVYMDLRERVSLIISEEAALLRRLYLALADRWVADARLRQRGDIFFLNRDEVRQLDDETLAAEAAQARVAERRAELEADAQLDLPEIVRGNLTPARVAPEVEAHEMLAGIGGSAGVVQGRARIVLDPTQAPPQLTRDDILVVPFTDVGWTPLLSGVGGIVAETGGQLSHTAIVAREYGLPAVVGVKRATQLVQEGQPITVDGGRGRVYLNPRPPEAETWNPP